MYDPKVGRFLSQDPLGLGPDANPYRYVGNSPLTKVDPFGLWTEASDQDEINGIHDGILKGTGGVDFVSRSVHGTSPGVLPTDGQSSLTWTPRNRYYSSSGDAAITFIDQVTEQYNVASVQFDGHAGGDIGGINLSDMKPALAWRASLRSSMLFYVDTTNAATFADRLMNAAPNTRVIFLLSCNLGNFTKSDQGIGEGNDAKSVAQIVANRAGVPVVTPGGYYKGQGIGPCPSEVDDTYDGKTFWGNCPDKSETTDESKKGKYYITYPWWWTNADKKNWKTKGTIPEKPRTPEELRKARETVKKEREEEKKKADEMRKKAEEMKKSQENKKTGVSKKDGSKKSAAITASLRFDY
jgi:hypothetical protein